MSEEEASEIARQVVAEIIHDLSDRRGLKWEWNGIDDDVKAEIVAKWEGIVRYRLIPF